MNFNKLVRIGLSFPRYFSAAKVLHESQWWKRDRLNAYIDDKLGRLIKHAYEQVPFYRNRFEKSGISPAAIKTAGDLSLLPVLSKETVRERFEELTATGFPPAKLMLYSTGGSTGIPTKFYHDAEEMAWTEAAVNRSYSWAGYRPLEKFLLVSGLPGEKHSVISLLRRLQGQRRISLFGAGQIEIEKSLDYLLRLRPRGLKGYVSWLEILAGALKKRGGPAVWKPAHVITSSEKLTPRSREVLRRGFGSEPSENYSSREFMLAAECSEHRGLHIAAENVIIETVRDGVPVAPGEWGEILVTDLNRYGMPLIRYAIGDVGVLSERVCGCGRGLPILEEVVGRVSDIIRTPEGKLIAAPAVAHIFKDLPVKTFRVVQDSEKELTVRVVSGDGYTADHEAHIRNAFRGIEIRIEYVEDIPVPASGKNLIVESRIKVF